MNAFKRPQPGPPSATTGDSGSAASTVFAAWVLTLGIDFFLHAGLLASFYVRESPFLLDPLRAFQRIPAGYLSFLLLTGSLYWLLSRLRQQGLWCGFRLGAGAGLMVWGALLLGLWSITTAPPDLLLGWWLGQGLELGFAGAVIGAVLGGVPHRKVWVWVGVCVAALGLTVVVMQSTGLAPAMQVP